MSVYNSEERGVGLASSIIVAQKTENGLVTYPIC
jgi:hypothetical protein